MADAPPLIFQKRMGALFCSNPAAQQAVAALSDGDTVRVKITRSRGNNRRLALYWVVLNIAAPMLSERCRGDALDVRMLHRVLKDRRGLYKQTILPSGEVVKDHESIGFAQMTEPDRSAYVNWSFETIAKWLGVSIEELLRAGEENV